MRWTPKFVQRRFLALIFKETISRFYNFFIYFRIYHNNGEYRRLTSRATTKFSVEVTWLIEKAKCPVQHRYYLVHEENYNDQIFQCRWHSCHFWRMVISKRVTLLTFLMDDDFKKAGTRAGITFVLSNAASWIILNFFESRVISIGMSL